MRKRRYKQGIDRRQAYLMPPTVDELIAQDNPVRAIEAYVDSLDLEAMGFKNAGGELTPGQPAYHPRIFVKLYLYGYLHRIRSSRRLEAECQRNLEVIWLVEGLRPSYKSIADFRKDNLEALKALHRDFVQLCRDLELFGAELVGIDGSFFRGNVSKKSIYTPGRLKRALERIERDIAQYLQELDQADEQEEGTSQSEPELKEKLQQLRDRQKKHKERMQKLEDSGEKQLAEVDEDARLLSKKGAGTIAGYNVQTVVDSKHKLLVCGEVTQDGNDQQQLEPMGKAAKAGLEVDELTTVQDRGYFNAQQIKECQKAGITPYVPEPDKQAQVRQQGRFSRDEFVYDAQANAYVCPAGEELKFSTTVEKRGKNIHHYRSQAVICEQCPLKAKCLPKKTPYRKVTRWEHEEVIEAHRARMAEEGAEKMRQRAELCEHPFGTLKQWCGWTHFLLRGLEKVRAEFSLLMLSYNFRRVLSIFGVATFRAYCRTRMRLNPVKSGFAS
jgi:transposase